MGDTVSFLSRCGARISRWVFRGLGLVLGACLPRRSDLVVFSQARRRYSGNSRALFESMLSRGVECYWLFEEGFDSGAVSPNAFVPRRSVRGMLLAARARWVVLSHGTADLGELWPAASRGSVLMLWHAIGLKGVGLTDRKTSDHDASAVRRESANYDLFAVSSEIDRHHTAAAHGIDVRKLHSSGLPRTDRYLERRQARVAAPEGGAGLRILYAPTFRDYPLTGPLFFPFDDFDPDGLRKWAGSIEGLRLDLRPHPNDAESTEQASDLADLLPSHIRLLSQAVLDDIDESLHEYDLVVTDYSSVFLEPLLADVPVVFVDFDLEKYERHRGLAYPYDVITPGPRVGTFECFREAVEQAQSGAMEWAAERERVRVMFFSHRDAGACERILELMHLRANTRPAG